MDARCSKCHRPLKNPQHAAAGIGPVCAEKLGLEFKRPKAPKIPRPKAPRKLRKTQAVLVQPLPFVELVEAVCADEV